MKRIVFCVAAIILVLAFTNANAEIAWEGDFSQFRYAIDHNGGSFFYNPLEYFANPNKTQAYAYLPLQGLTDPYNSIATTDVIAYDKPGVPGQINLKALAKGPDGGINPENGLTVQAYADIIPDSLDSGNGMDVQQEVVTFIVRKFSVTQNGRYNIRADLSGMIDFDAFGSGNYFASYDISATAELEQWIKSGDQETIDPTFTLKLELDENARRRVASANLITQNAQQQNVSYRLKVVLNIASNIRNYDFATGAVLGPISGPYKLGDENSPLKLTAVLSQGGGLPANPLLLLDD